MALSDSAAIMEVGPGEGQLLAKLASLFSNLTALDNSKDMLEKSRETVAATGHDDVEFILGDTAVAKKQNVKYFHSTPFLSDLLNRICFTSRQVKYKCRNI